MPAVARVGVSGRRPLSNLRPSISDRPHQRQVSILGHQLAEGFRQASRNPNGLGFRARINPAQYTVMCRSMKALERLNSRFLQHMQLTRG
jgi:hypothetical protein